MNGNIFMCTKISRFHVKAHLVFHWWLHINKLTVIKDYKSMFNTSLLCSSFWVVTRCSLQRNGCSHPNCIPLPKQASDSCPFIFENLLVPNSPYEPLHHVLRNVKNEHGESGDASLVTQIDFCLSCRQKIPATLEGAFYLETQMFKIFELSPY